MEKNITIHICKNEYLDVFLKYDIKEKHHENGR